MFCVEVVDFAFSDRKDRERLKRRAAVQTPSSYPWALPTATPAELSNAQYKAAPVLLPANGFSSMVVVQ